MNWLTEQYQQEKYRDEQRAAGHQAEVQAARDNVTPSTKQPRRVRHSLGSKMIELGTRLCDSEPLPAPEPGAI